MTKPLPTPPERVPTLSITDIDGDALTLHMDDEHAPLATLEISSEGSDMAVYVDHDAAKQMIQWLTRALR